MVKKWLRIRIFSNLGRFSFNLKLILQILKALSETSSSYDRFQRFRQTVTIKRGINLFLLTILVAGMFGFFPISSANASFLSLFDKLLSLSDKKEEVEKLDANSQTARLLEPVLNSNPTFAFGGGDITIANQSVLVSDVGPLGSIADINENVSNPDNISTYVVRKGDSLTGIAKMFGVTVNTIVWANDLGKGNLIQPGQLLVILPVPGVRYVVQKGDTLTTISSKFKGDKDEIIRFNNLASNSDLKVGQEIIIPDGEVTVSASSSINSSRKGAARNEGTAYADYYMRPIGGGIKTQGIHGYNGVDLATSCGSPVYASASGEVIVSRSSGWNSGYGQYIVISHANNTQTLYAHLQENSVTAGWRVAKGQIIGEVGSTGKSTGCHVHFEVRGARNPF
ncbi:MAG: peptidoglycan DD-metalloendopeptidase family protein [bacterium]|nr:peptidoglycan DD-metalloendopeptidase family protein [bacterium]